MRKLKRPIQISSRREQFLNRRYYPIAGADEAGRGALAGPLTVAMVILKFPLHSFLAEHLNDSKQVAALLREQLFSCIVEHSIAYAISSVGNKVIDAKKLTAASSLALERCYKKMKLKPRSFLLDKGLAMPPMFPSALPRFSLIKGDEKSFSIAAASILAKVSRDRIMSRLHSRGFHFYGFAQNKGYGVKKHIRALQEQGVCAFHRKSYAPVSRLLASSTKNSEENLEG